MILENRFNLDKLTFSCISAPIKTVQADLKKELADFGDDWKVEKYELLKNKQIDSFFNDDENKVIKYLLWKPKLATNDYTVFLSNFTDGWITLMNSYSRSHNRKIIYVGICDPTRKYPVYRFYYLNNGEQRVVQLLKDTDRWDFYSHGTPLKIETVKNYRQEKKWTGLIIISLSAT